jgi:hypothetical protein
MRPPGEFIKMGSKLDSDFAENELSEVRGKRVFETAFSENRELKRFRNLSRITPG